MNRLHRWYCGSSHWKRGLETTMPWALNGTVFGDEILEIGPGPGLTTEWLRHRCKHLTCLEIDAELVRSLCDRVRHGNVSVQCGDATLMPFADRTFNNAVSFTMLHHVSSAELQDQMFAEVYRVLKPGGSFAGMDSAPSLRMEVFHIFDTMVLVDPKTLPARLEAAGFVDIAVEALPQRFRFAARRRY